MHATLSDVNRVPAIAVRYPVRPRLSEWVLTEGTVPESIPHDATAEYLKLVLRAWAARQDRNVWIARNLAIRWVETAPRVGIDPDVCVLDPPPPDVEALKSLRLWLPDHVPPSLCLEVVSQNHPHKDYSNLQDRYAAIGCQELLICDPQLAGAQTLGGPVPLQLWRRDPIGIFERQHFGDAPVFSEVLRAWMSVTGSSVVLSDDRAGTRRWLTPEEHERSEKEHERSEKERERSEKERERSEKERERAARLALEERLAALEAKQKV
jgi:hypothetical protein